MSLYGDALQKTYPKTQDLILLMQLERPFKIILEKLHLILQLLKAALDKK